MKISTRLWLPTLAISAVLLVLALMVVVRTQGQISGDQERLQRTQAKAAEAANWQSLTSANAVRVVASVLSNDPQVATGFIAEIDSATTQIDAIQKRVEAAAGSDTEKAALAKLGELRKAYISARTAAQKLKADGDAKGAQALLDSQVRPAIASYTNALADFIKLQNQLEAQQRQDTSDAGMRTVWATVAVFGLIVAAMVSATALLVRSIQRPMGELAELAQRIGQGDLEAVVPSARDDEIGRVMQSLAGMRDALRGIVGQVRLAADSIQVASSEVAAGNGDLSQRTEQTASQLQQTASSMEQLTGNVRQSADAAAQANQLAASATAVAQRGGEVVSQVVSTMDEINSSSKRIADIIGTIDGIAFQTNILALNAAVEAARAGEQGRGFAVVAGEVRSLAQRSAEAAREIKSLIGSSVERVEAGARLVQDAGSTMGEIVTSVQRVSDIINEITAASSEQSQGIGQVNQAVGNLDQMTQQNAALVEQSAAAAESLKEQASKLGQVMQVFRMGGSGGSGGSGGVPGFGSAGGSTRPAPATGHNSTQARAPAPPPIASPAPAPAPAPSPQAAAPAAHKPARAPAPATASAGPSDDWETF